MNNFDYIRHKYEPIRRVNIVHFNDMHENVNHLDSFITARDEFYRSHPEDTNLTLAAGDIFNRFAQDERVVGNFVRDYVDATATGNRDLEKGKRLSKAIQKYGLGDKFVATNVYFDSYNPLESQITKTKVVDGVGIIGLAPVDFKVRWKRKDNSNIRAKQLDETIKSVRDSVKELEGKGVNKIVVLAHTGEFSGHNPWDKHEIDYYKKLSEIGGVDVIIGGHDHRKTDRWEITERREPVKIVSTGADDKTNFSADLNEFGEMSLVFDKNGVLQKPACKNSFIRTDDYPKSGFVEQFPRKFINTGKLTERAVSGFFKLKNKIFPHKQSAGEPKIYSNTTENNQL